MKISWKKMNRAALGALACGVLLAGAPVALADDKPSLVGRVIDIDGPRLKTNRLKEAKWYQAYPKMNTYLKERMKADDKTTATIEFLAGGRAVVAPGTQIEIVGPRKAEIVSGTVWLKFDKDRLNKEEFEIQTSGGVMGIEGTEFIVETDEATGETKLVVVEGAVRVNNGADSQLVRGGDASDFGRNALTVANYATYGTPYSAVRDLAFAKVDPETARVLRPVVNRALWHVPGRYRINRLFYGRGFGVARRSLNFLNTGRVYVPVLGSVDVGGFSFKKPKKPVTAIVASGGTPTFNWTEGGGVKNYSVVVANDSKGEDVVWYGENKSGKRTMQYPEYGPALTAGQTYHVFVTPLKKNGEPRTEKEKSLAGQGTFVAAGHQPIYQSFSGVTAETSNGAPVIRWKAQKKAATYRVEIEGPDGPVWAAESTETGYQYPATARALTPGPYKAKVRAFDSAGNKFAESDPVSFSTVAWESDGLSGPARKEARAPQGSFAERFEPISWLMNREHEEHSGK